MTRRRVATSKAVVGLAVVATVAVLAFSIIGGWPDSFWGWALRAVPVVVLLVALRDLGQQTGRLVALRNRGLGALTLVLGLAVITLVAVGATRATPQLGLDLQGGFSVVLTPEGDPPSENIDQAMAIIRQRIDALGIAEPEVTRQGDNVVVELPGIDDREQAHQLVGQTARLEFRPVLAPLMYDAEAAERGEDPCVAAEQEVTIEDTVEDLDPDLAPEGDVPEGEVPEGEVPEDPAAPEAPAGEDAPDGAEEGALARTPPPVAVVDGENAAAPLPRQDPEDTTTTAALEEPATTTVPAEPPPDTTLPEDPADPAAGSEDTLVAPAQEGGVCYELGPVGFEGDALSRAVAELGGATGSEWTVSVTIRGQDRADANALFNACNAGGPECPAGPGGNGQLAIVLDGQVVSAPNVQSPNLADDDFVITGGGQGGFREGDAKDLALVLRYGALPVVFERSAESQVSATLGDDSLRAGMIAGAIGLGLVALYLVLYYRALGLVVVAGLGVWGTLMYGTVTWLSSTQGLTLSLAGVVGIVVSVGTTVDSYVVHFERLKDEVRLGKSVRASTEKAFSRAFRTILTADIASLIGAALLWYLTVGAVRGFAFFLGLSVVLDIFVAYCFDRPTVALLSRSRFLTEHRFFGVARGLGRSEDVRARPAGATS